MKIAIVSKSGVTGGGASRIASELAGLLGEQGILAGHYLVHYPGALPADTHRMYGGNKVMRRSVYYAHRAFQKLGAPEAVPFELLSSVTRNKLLEADLIHVHDISDALSPLTLRWLAARKPLVWTLHDCSPFTAGCINPLSCEKFRSTAGCHACPQHGTWPFHGLFDMTPLLQKQKRKFAMHSTFTGIAPCEWMADMAGSTSFFPRPRVISNGINLSVFKPTLKAEARGAMGIPTGRLVLAVCCSDLKDERKGMRVALEVLRTVRHLNPLVLAIGKASAEVQAELDGLEVRFTGYIRDREELARAYSAADALVYCVLADNQPLTVMEALACGTPVLGFATGGIPELVSSGVDGYLVPTGDHIGLAKALPGILEERATLALWSKRSADKAVEKFGYDRFLSAHVELYKELLGTVSTSKNIL
jgi:glycosyltransferase involved in cell wall biosynthesis